MPTLRERSDGGNAVVNNCSTCNLKCRRSFIRCNECNKFYFFSCHEITKDMAEQMSRFYCLPCRRKNPSLHVTYKETPHEKGVRIGSSECSVLPHQWEQFKHGLQLRRRSASECDFVRCFFRPEKCICTVPNECEPYSIQCQRCGRWCHYECEGFTFKTAKEITAYYCLQCRYYYDLNVEYIPKQRPPHSSGNPPKRPRTNGARIGRSNIINVDGPPEGTSPRIPLLMTVNIPGEPALQPEVSAPSVNQLSTEENAPDSDPQSQQRAVGDRDAHATGLLSSRTRIIRVGQLFRGKNRVVHANRGSVRELQATINQKNALVRQLKEAAKQQADELQRSKDEWNRIADEKNREIRTLQDRLSAAEHLGQSTSRSEVVPCDRDPELQRLKEENRQLAEKVRDREAVIVRLTLAANGFNS